MAVEIGPVYRRPIPPLPREIRDQTSPVPNPEKGNVGRLDYAALVRLRQQKTYRLNSTSMEERPLEPLEPEPFRATALEWAEYVIKRDIAREYEAEHSLRGVPFS